MSWSLDLRPHTVRNNPLVGCVILPLKLPLTVEPEERETLFSFFSRTAALQGTESIGFALDLGLNFKRLVDYEPDAIAMFAAKAGLSDERLAQMMSWTGERVGDVRMRYRGEIMVSRALRSPVVRGCPICLRGDGRDARPPLRHMVMQGSWLCRGVDICLAHHHLLVPLWERAKLTERENISTRLSEIWPALRDGRLDQEPVAPTPYDTWLDCRLSGQPDPTWLASHSLFAAMRFCELLGTELRRMQSLTEDDRAAKALGFQFASKGPQAIQKAFGQISGVDGHPDVNRGAFGALFDKLEYVYRDDPGFDAFRALLREHVVRIWPIAAGEILLGQVLERRMVHSVLTASRETGLYTGLLDAALTEAGVFAQTDTRPPSTKIFDAQRHECLLHEIATRVGPKAMREAMGATLPEFRALVAAGVLVPRSRLPKVKKPWSLPDGLGLFEDLEGHASDLPPDAHGWDTIHLASKQAGIPIGEIIAAIREGRLQLRKRPEVAGFHGLMVSLAALQAVQSPRIGAAAFARAIGIRDYVAFTELIEAGHVNATRIKNTKTARLQWMMSDAEIADFRRRFATPTMITEETGLHRNTIFAVFSAAGVRPFRPDGLDAGPMYLRQDSMPAIKEYLAKQ